MRRAFTMIELIFIIVIIGILAYEALPKLFATRDDARVSAEIRNLEVCLTDISSSYTAFDRESLDSAACMNIKCEIIELGDLKDGKVDVLFREDKRTPNFCQEVRAMAIERGMSGTLTFGGMRIAK